MSTGRVEAFSDGVIAIIVTIMVLELKVPDDATLRSLGKVVPLFLVYALSFLTVAIMWVNHHHYLKTARRAEPSLLWSNNNLLFWMSLIPFATRYLGQNPSSPLPVALYAGLMGVTAAAFYWLIRFWADRTRKRSERSPRISPARGWPRRCRRQRWPSLWSCPLSTLFPKRN